MKHAPCHHLSGNLIAASAGTGKTYQLTSRFVALLALGALPEKMIALTFTKKAAGEFRNRIFQALSEGALGKADREHPSRNALAARVWESWTGLHLKSDMTLSPAANPVPLYPAAIPMLERAAARHCYPEELTPDAGEPPLPQLTSDFFARLLIRVLSKSSELQLSTLDSFFNRVVGADLQRAGLSSLSPMNALQQQRATRTALLAMLEESEKGDSHHESALITLLSSITEDKGGALLDLLEKNVNTYLSLYKDFPQAEPWGNPLPFGLPDCSEARLLSDEELERSQLKINAIVEGLSWGKDRRHVKRSFSSLCSNLRNGTFSPSASFNGWLQAEEKFTAPHGEQTLDDELRECVTELLQRWKRQCLRSVQKRSAAMHKLLSRYDAAYRDCILREGLCTFDDIKQGARQLLGLSAAGEESGMALHLTTRLDHWLLDEFQDTDPVQWEILSDLLKENAQHPDKTLFVVGDKKQSIYSFRGASAELFEQLRGTIPARDGFNWQQQGLVNSTLSESRRSVPEIMNFTNLVFEALPETDREFARHSTHASNHDKEGYVRVRVLPKGGADETLQAICRSIGEILEELTEAAPAGQRQLKNGISVAILLRKGASARSIVAWLRRYKPEIPVQLVEDSPLAEASPLGELLLSFFLWLKQPADQYRYNVLRVSPLGSIMSADDDGTPLSPAAAWDTWNQRLNTRGYAAVIQQLAGFLPQLDSRRMLTEWLEEAVGFDASGGSLDEWLLHMRTCCRKENGSARYVQVMTMHKSKGAEFDAVILPFLGSHAVDQPRNGGIPYFISADQKGILVHPGTSNERRQWPELVDYENTWKRARRDDSYNLMYVALTRARFANYLLLPEREKEKFDKESDWIQAALQEKGFTPAPENDVTFGRADWYLQKPARPAAPPLRHAAAPLGDVRHDRKRVSPSAMTDEAPSAKPAEQSTGSDTSAADFGTKVHACFEQITWLHEGLPDWLSTPQSAAQQVVANALQQPEIAALFTARPGQEACNEQSIEAINSRNEWVSATIDRLVLTHDAQGKVTAAHIIDFKTNKPGEREEYPDFGAWLLDHYTGQLREYRKLIAAAFQLDAESITVSLISCPMGHPARILTYPADKLK